MAFEVVMPQMGADMTEGTLVSWLKAPGDKVERGDIIAEIETDKATVELEVFEAGVLRKVIAQEGDVVPVGEVIALLGNADEEMPEVVPRQEMESSQVVEKPRPRAVTAPSADGTGSDLDARRVRVSPVARRIAQDAGIEITEVVGSGPDGRILRRDVEAFIAGSAQHSGVGVPTVEPDSPPPPNPSRVEPLSRMRTAIARNMIDAKQRQPHYYLTVDVDMTEAMAFRRHINLVLHEEQRVSVNDMLVKASAVALVSHSKFNASLTDDGIQYHEQVDINIGVALDEGLIAPALIDVAAKPLPQIAEESKGLVDRARAGRLRAEEYSSGTFTITNLGAYGIDVLVGIINAGQAAILGVGSITARPAVVDEDISVRQLMTLALSADHRVTDGAEGARFLKEIQSILENPSRLTV